jgi:glycosyltransferase involved in cell wall biosynthesis
MSLRVGVDAWNLLSDRRGIGRYVREIVRAWAALGSQRVQPVLLVPERNTLLARGRYEQEAGAKLPVRNRRHASEVDIVWFPWNGMSWLPATAAVATLHDASLFRLPPQDPAVREKEQRPFVVAAAQARRIITDSEFSKKELVHYLGVAPDKVDVVSLGVSAVFFESRARQERGSYLLFVGNVEARKGLETVVDALKILPAHIRNGLELVIVGAGGKVSWYLGQAHEVRIRAVGWVDDPKLAELYRGALALVYPSEYEGFGLPILEAMACGTLVIASDTPSSHEAGGSAAIYVAPRDVCALAEAIAGLVSSSADIDIKKERRARGRELARAHTWYKTAVQTLASIELGEQGR